jgi:hypothetical protein
MGSNHTRANQGRDAAALVIDQDRSVEQTRLNAHVEATKNRSKSLEFCRDLPSHCSPEVRIAVMLDNFGPHLSTERGPRLGKWAKASNVELACVSLDARVAEPHRVSRCRSALLRSGWHRLLQSIKQNPHGSALHHLAESPHRRQPKLHAASMRAEVG